MDKINSKLQKYRNKLINATSAEKMEIYNLKMQQYLILQKKIVKEGGSKDIFALTEDTQKKIKSNENVYNVNSVENFLTGMRENLTNVSTNYNTLQNENKELTSEIINLHRNAAQLIKSQNIEDSPTVKGIEDAIKLFEPIQNVLVTYYENELKTLDKEDNEKVKYILEELELFEKSTKDLIAEKVCNTELPESIRNILCLQNNQQPEMPIIEEGNNEEMKGGKKYIYKRY